jgi:transporter family-2 protein
MTNVLWLLSVAVLGGVAIALQAQMMGLLDRDLGTLESVCITYGGGGLLIGLVMLAKRGGNLSAWQSVPWYALLSGAVGLVIVGAIGYCVPRLGLVASFTVLIAAQFFAAALLDHFGILGAVQRPLEPVRLVGLMVVLVGVWMVIR